MATKKTADLKSATSTAVATVKPKSSSIVNIQDQLRAQAAMMAGRVAPASGNAIRITQDKKFALPTGEKVDDLSVVIVDFVSRNEFYEGSYDPNNIVPPVCFAIGDDPRNMVPSDNSPAKQSDSCNSCPMNQFGSAGNGKACKNSRMLAVVQPDVSEGDEDPIWTLKVSPTGLKSFDGFVTAVMRTGLPPVGVVAEVSFDPNVTYASTRFGNPTPNENAGVHLARQDEARDIIAREPDLTERAPAPAKARPVARKPMATARR